MPTFIRMGITKMARRKPKQLLFFAITRSSSSLKAGNRKRKKAKKKAAAKVAPPVSSFRKMLANEDVDFESLSPEDQAYLVAIQEQRKREVQAKWTGRDELCRRLGTFSPDYRQYSETSDGRFAEKLVLDSMNSSELGIIESPD